MSIEDFYTSTALVEQLIGTSNPMGGQVKNYSARITSMPCRVSRGKPIEVVEFGKETMRITWKLYCEANSANIAIVETDRITVSGKVFDVTGIYNPGLLNHHLELNVLEVK